VVDVNTTVFNKQLEELESLADSAGLYDDQQEDDEEEVQAEPSIEWRRASLEEAYSRVKRAKGRPVDPNRVYEIGTLLFEPAEGKFGRVKRSVPGYLCIQFLRGGEREYGRRPDAESYLRDHHRGKTAAELAAQLGLTETEVQGHLNRLGLIRVDHIPGTESDGHHHDKDVKVVPKEKPRRIATKDIIPGVNEEDLPGSEAMEKKSHKKIVQQAKSKLPSPADDDLESRPLPPKGKDVKSSLPKKVDAKTATPGKTVTPGKTATPGKATQTPKSGAPQKASTGKTSVPPAKGKSTVPPAKDAKDAKPGAAMSQADANAFIKKHYKDMNNRDLAKKTGLSEHTVRRKLGEWTLKRPKE